MITACYFTVAFLSMFYVLPVECLNGFKYQAMDSEVEDGGKNWHESPPLSQYRLNNGQLSYGRRKRIGYKPATCSCTCETKLLKSNSNRQSFGDERIARNHEEKMLEAKQRFDSQENHPVLDDAYAEKNADNMDGFEKFSWQQLPDTECYRRSCSSDGDCCKRYHSCDKSARVCVDCWRGFSCKTDDDCCFKYPRCEVNPKTGGKVGKCVDD